MIMRLICFYMGTTNAKAEDIAVVEDAPTVNHWYGIRQL